MNPDQPTANRPPNQDPATRGANRPALGTTAIGFSPPPRTGEEKPVRERRTAQRAERYKMQGVARDIIYRDGKYKNLEKPASNHRVCNCRRARHGSEAKVHRSKEHRTAHYGGLQTCGSPWACPVCSALVQNRRRVEIEQAIGWARGEGLEPVMVTLTFPHTRWDAVRDLLAKQSEALKKMRAGKWWQKFKARIGYEGMIRTLELTHGGEGGNGWHPHTHELWFLGPGVTKEGLEEVITERWLAACKKAGLVGDDPEKEGHFRAHAVDVVVSAEATAKYLTKTKLKATGTDLKNAWELAPATASKSARSFNGRTPFQILAAAESDESEARLFLEYVKATQRKAMVFWSQGLKKRVGIDEKTDEEVAQEKQDDADLLAVLTQEHWQRVVDEKARATILDLAEVGGFDAIADWLAYYGLPPPARKVS